jgi:hypothetical protein
MESRVGLCLRVFLLLVLCFTSGGRCDITAAGDEKRSPKIGNYKDGALPYLITISDYYLGSLFFYEKKSD